MKLSFYEDFQTYTFFIKHLAIVSTKLCESCCKFPIFIFSLKQTYATSIAPLAFPDLL